MVFVVLHKPSEMKDDYFNNINVMLVTQSCPTLCHLMDRSPPDSSVHGILQARILEWVAIPFSRGYSHGSPALPADSLPSESPGQTPVLAAIHAASRVCYHYACTLPVFLRAVKSDSRSSNSTSDPYWLSDLKWAGSWTLGPHFLICRMGLLP